MSREPQETQETLEVLRALWNARGQSETELEEPDHTGRSCKRMTDVGFGGLADEDGDLRAAWRAALDRDGKLNRKAGASLADLVLGPPEARN